MKLRYTDEDRINFLELLQRDHTYSDKCVLRMSRTGRGWRLHELMNEEGLPFVRQAIDKYMRESGYEV